MNWQLQEAKNRLSEVVKAAKTKGPQIITVRARWVAFMLLTMVTVLDGRDAAATHARLTSRDPALGKNRIRVATGKDPHRDPTRLRQLDVKRHWQRTPVGDDFFPLRHFAVDD